jgi:hypothetical protein
MDDARHVSVESVTVRGDSAHVSMRAGVVTGDAKVNFEAPGFESRQVTLTTTADISDTVGNGTPDFLRLHGAVDRAAFREWFTLLAESQYSRHTSMAEIGDCAALLRYAYREALRQHLATWGQSRRIADSTSSG